MGNLFEKIFGLEFKKDKGYNLSNKKDTHPDWTFGLIMKKFWWYFAILIINFIYLMQTSPHSLGRGIFLISFIPLLSIGIIVAIINWISYSGDKKSDEEK